MKTINYLFLTFLLAAVFVSCQQENLDPNSENAANFKNDELQLDTKEFLTDENQILDVIEKKLAEKGINATKGFGAATLYTASNETAANQILAFREGSDGTLSEFGRYDTGGTGTNTGLGNQSALVTGLFGKLLFAVNPGSNSISLFYIFNNGSLYLLDSIASGGERPVSVDYRNGLIYVLNAGGTGNISGFGISFFGGLYAIPNSTRNLSGDATGPAQVAFSSNGRALVVTEKATNTISSYALDFTGRPGSINTFASAGTTPFGFTFGRYNLFYVSEAAGGNPGASTISSYHINNAGSVSLVDGPLATNETAVCWIALTKRGITKTLFGSNTGGATISSLSVSATGQLSISNNGNSTPTETTPLDIALDRKDKYFYVLASGTNLIVSYQVGANGALTQIDLDGIPDNCTGLIVR